MRPSETTPAPGNLRRSVSNTLKGSAGNLVEWYDVYVYSVFATYFEAKFFSADDRNATLYVWAIFAMTFLMRPIGAWYFGRFADRHGRRLALTVSVTLMALCSFLIAITPTAASTSPSASGNAERRLPPSTRPHEQNGRKPSTTRLGKPRLRAISAIAEAYCSLSPTIALPASSWSIR